MRNLRNALVIVVSAAAAWLVAGCSAKGPAFVPINPIPPGKGVVYVYRVPKFAGSGVFGTLSANNVALTKVRNGGYYPYVTAPGPVHLAVKTEATNTADVEVKEGQDKYVKTTIGMGFFVGHLKLTEVSRDIGAAEITKCRLLEALP